MTTHQPLPPFAGWAGPRRPRLLLVGEAWGENEEAMKAPFVGTSGKELFLMLGEAMPTVAPELHAAAVGWMKYDLAWVKHRGPWLEAAGIALTNVLAFRPPDNKLEALCVPRSAVPATYPLPAVARGLYLRPEYLPELARLFAEITLAAPNLVVVLGNTACWALLRAVNIGSIRGATAESAGLVLGPANAADTGNPPQVKVLPTYHPAAVMRQWSWRPIVVADLMKAAREMGFPNIRRPQREVTVNPTIEDVRCWCRNIPSVGCQYISCDIETGAGQIKCVGFADRRDDALVIPFVNQESPDYSYWSNPSDEREAWGWVKSVLESPWPKVGQNFIYDLQYLTKMGIRPRNCIEDTMLLHHAHFPEMLKGLGFLGSIYTDEAPWKLMRRSKPDTEKRDE